MADFVKGLFGGQQPAQVVVSSDDDFADYAGAPNPEPASISVFTAGSSPSPVPTASAIGQVPYTKWYRVWERTTVDDFKLEMYVFPFLLLMVFVHLWGTKANRRKATEWMTSHAPVLQKEFAQVGYKRPQATIDDVASIGLAQATDKAKKDAIAPENLIREKKPDEFTTYATGRLNIAFVDFKLTLAKRYNPLLRFGEKAVGMFFESMPAPEERMEATAYVFDGRESAIVPAVKKGVQKKSVNNSTFDGFVFAVVHKDLMRQLRDDRYDLSLTTTKDHPKLPIWATVMSESAEVTEKMLTPELIKAINGAGDKFEALIISDQPMNQPRNLNDTIPKKRINLSVKLGATHDDTLPLFAYFLRLTDYLVATAHFRPEVMRRVKQTREDQIAKIRKVDDDEKAEERKLQSDKAKKEKRDALLSGMSASAQKKFLDKEREKETKKREKRKTMKG